MEEAPQGSGRPLALVTGASSGIGAAFARRLAKEGYDLVLVARRKDRLENLAGELHHTCAIHAEALAADLCKNEDLRRVEQHIERAAHFEFLVNNAGLGMLPLFHEADVESLDQMYRLHVLATMRLCRAALPVLLARKKGYIVNVSSVAAFLQGPGNVSYCSTKAWINSFTEGLYLELRETRADVRVQALCPGFTYSEFHDTLGVDRSFVGKSWWMSADEVVDASLAGLRRGKLIVVPGLRYKLIVFALSVLPRFVRHAIAKRRPANRRKQIVHGQREG
jgi:short-subunit dehydrogenase